MWRRLLPMLILLISGLAKSGIAQRVLYAPPLDDRFLFDYKVRGQVGQYYWIEKINRKRGARRSADPWGPDKQVLFEIYDSRLMPVETLAAPEIPGNTIRIYLVPGRRFFDRLLLIDKGGQTQLVLNRYSPGGETVAENRPLVSLPFADNGNGFLLLRSQDKSKLMLLGFEPVPESAPKLHSVLFDENWNLLSDTTYIHPFLTQPFIQYDFEQFPIDNFVTSPVKLCNDGEWLMAGSSRTNHNYLLFQFDPRRGDSAMAFSEIRLPPSGTLEDLALYIDEGERRAQLCILSRLHYQTVKSATVAQYSIGEKRFDFDTTYRFNTLAGAKIRNENLVQEYLIAIPGNGFMLLKEYGREYWGDDWERRRSFRADPETDPLLNGVISQAVIPIRRNDYTRNNSLGGMRDSYTRGDLSLFFFPASKEDSCWSGMINQEQRTNLSTSYLSYLVLPVDGRLVILYNSLQRNNEEFASSTILDRNGSEVNGEGVIFWKMNNNFNFQAACQLASNEVAVPYQRNGRQGFAIMRL